MGCGARTVAIDLIDRFPSAIEVRPAPAAFSLADVVIAGRTEHAIVPATPSRLVYNISVPRAAELHVSLGVPDAGSRTTNAGVLFRVLVATDGSPGPDVLFSRRLSPSTNPADGVWQDVIVDLSLFSGQTVALFLNTNVEPDGGHGAWGAPRILAR